MKLSFFRALLPACLFCVASPAVIFAAGEKQYPNYNFAISPPNDWLDTTASAGQKGVVASFGSPDHTRAVFVLVEDRAVPIGEWNDAFVAEFDRAAEPNLGKRLSGKFVAVQGIKSYERTSAPVVQGKTISMISRTAPVGTRFYSLQGYNFAGGNAGEDPQVRELLDSFRFLIPPPGASSATAVEAAPAPPGEQPLPSTVNSTTATQPAQAPTGEPLPPPAANPTAVAQPASAIRAEAPPSPAATAATDPRAKDLDNAFKRGQAIGRMLAALLIVGVPIFIIVWFVRRGKRRTPGVLPPPAPSPRPQSAMPPRPPVPMESRPPPPSAAPRMPLRPANPLVSRAAPLFPPSAPPGPTPASPAGPKPRTSPTTLPAPPAARPVSPPTAPAPPSAPTEPPPAPPTATPSLPAPSPAAPAPPTRPFVIRPRQRHMRG